MKIKIVLLATLLAFAGVASAQSSVTTTWGVQPLVPNTAQNHIVNFAAKTAINDTFAVDAGIYTTVGDTTNAVTNRYEAGLTGKYELTSVVAADLRVATGIKQKSGVNDFTYYSLEPGVNAKFGDITARVALRYRDAYQGDANADQSRTMRYALGYNVTAKDKVTVGYDRLRGDGANNTTYVAYTRSF
jgi:hypothetical protein